MIYGERTNRTAFFVSGNGAQKMKRVPFMSGEFSEAWLQGLIEGNPSIIPSGEVSPDYAPLVCIGREVPVGSGDTRGYIDNLYITPTGHLVIVETKLFRNQESRRTVVAQIIDYAKELQQWDAEQLDAVAADYLYERDGQAARIIDVMAEAGYLSLSDEAALTDAINENLANAAFLLMIVGDGIRSNVAQLAEFLNENTSMAFNLALAEMEIYRVDGGVVVVPNLLLKTVIVERRPLWSHVAPAQFVPSIEPQRYVAKPVLSRRQFVETFSSRGGYDPDLLTEFLADMETVDGISINITPTELHIDCMPASSVRATILYVGISGDREASIYMRPDKLREILGATGHFPSEADSFLEFYRDYVDLSRCKSAPYDFGANRFYYAQVGKVLENSAHFVAAAERLICDISDNKTED